MVCGALRKRDIGVSEYPIRRSRMVAPLGNNGSVDAASPGRLETPPPLDGVRILPLFASNRKA